tara:strand:- start:690 stop:875 length:186 start_codon:yes stop_codon:yes gene_type:complete
MTPDTEITRLAQALVLAITSPQAREAEADRLAQQLAHGMTPEAIAEAQELALYDLQDRLGA